jgi:hypothetical protein
MSNEREQKYYLTENTFRKINKSKIIEKLGIIQWYQNGDEDKRYRLTLKKLPTGYFQEWTYTEKKETDDPSTRDEKEKSVSPEKIAKEFEEFKNYNMVSKIRYVFKKDPEIVIDEFLSPYGHKINDDNIKGLQYLLEIEEKENPITDFDEALKKVDFPIDLLKSVDAEDDRYKNKNLATKFEGKESTLDIIDYVKNRLKGDITLVMPIGKAIIGKLNDYVDKGTYKIDNVIKDASKFQKLYNNGEIDKFDFNSAENNELVENLSPEIGTLKKLINVGYDIKSIIAFIPKPYINNDNDTKIPTFKKLIGKYNSSKYKNDDVSYSFLGNKIFFQEWFGIKDENIKAIPIAYDNKNENTIKNSFKEIWKKLDNLDIKNDSKELQENNNVQEKKVESDSYIIDIAPGLKYIGVIFSLYAMFNNKEFYYKQEYQESLSKFSSFGIDWDYNFFDEFSSIANALDFEDEDKNIAIKDFLTLPENLKNIFTQINGEIKSFYPIKEIIKNYKDKRDMPFGFGQWFLKVFSSNDNPQKTNAEIFRDYIKNMTTQKWSKQWIGDLIPETVEHSQRHSKRLLDFTANLINVIGEENFLPKELSEENYYEIKDTKNMYGKKREIHYKYIYYFILAVAINVHDLGHTYFKYTLNNGREIYLDNYPSVIRDLHNELTVQLIDDKIFNILDNEKLNELFTNNEVEEIKTAIKLVCKYHRGHLPITEEDIKNGSTKNFVKYFTLDVRPLTQVLEEDYPNLNENIKEIIKHASRWLKFIDGTDVQSDRVVTTDYHFARQRRTKFEILTLIDKYTTTFGKYDNLRELKKLVERIKTEAFIKDQKNLFDNIGTIAEKIENEVYIDIVDKIDKNEKGINDPKKELLDVIAFKARQFPHFEKHRSVAAIYPTWLEWDKDKNESFLHIKLIENTMDQKKADINKEEIEEIKKEIKKELDKANITINGKKLKLSFEEKAEMKDDK